MNKTNHNFLCFISKLSLDNVFKNNDKLVNLGMLIARIWLTITILNTGLYKISHYAGTADMMTAMGIPAVLLPFAILLDIGGSLAIIFGFLTRILSLIMIGYVIACVILFKLDPHLTLSELSWMGGLFLLAITGAGKWSIDYLLKK